MSAQEQINSVVVGDGVVIKYNHPHKVGQPEYTGVVETVAQYYIRIKRADNSFRTFHKSDIVSIVKQ